MTAVQLANNSEFINLSNNLLSELKTSYPSWEDLITKTGKFHSSLKVVTQSSSAFIDALQKVADLASKTYGGSREIGTCLTRLCLRQRRLETKLKSMSNHLITSLATPLSNKLDEWRRTLTQLEKDRTRQTKRARADLKRAVSEADRWQKKAAKCGSSELGPGVGHGVLPSSNLSGSKASVIAAQAANALREVQLKTEILESTEKASMRGLMLEERGRFCFFLSCLLPLLECQCSMLSEISAIEELMQPLSKAMSNPDQLMDDAEAFLFRTGHDDLSSLSRISSTKISACSPDGIDHGSRLIAAATAALYADYDRANAGSSDDTDSGRLTMEISPMESKTDDQLDGCSLSSANQSLQGGDNVFFNNPPGAAVPAVQNNYNNYRWNTMSDAPSPSEFNSHAGGSHGHGGNQRPHILHGFSIPHAFNTSAHLMGQRKPSVPGTTAANPLVTSYHMSHCPPQQADTDDTQFQTLCRPGHCRSSSMGDPKLAAQLNASQAQLDKTLVDSKQQTSPSIAFGVNRPPIDPNWLRNCDEMNDESDANEDSVNSSGIQQSSTPVDDEGGEYVAVQEEVNVCGSAQTSGNVGALLNQDAGNLNFGRHTISSAYERGTTANVRGSINNLSFNPPIGKSSSKDSGVDSSTVLYPNQALPPPVYTNLTQLAHAAQRKFSISNIPPTVGTPPPSPSRLLASREKLSGSLTSTNLVDTTQQNFAIPRRAEIHQSVTELSNVRSVPQQLMNMSPGSQMVNRRASVAPASTIGPRPCSNGIDPFSVELDELDRLGGTGVASISRSQSLFGSTLQVSPSIKRDSSMITFLNPTSSPHSTEQRSHHISARASKISRRPHFSQRSLDLSSTDSSSQETLSNLLPPFEPSAVEPVINDTCSALFSKMKRFEAISMTSLPLRSEYPEHTSWLTYATTNRTRSLAPSAISTLSKCTPPVGTSPVMRAKRLTLGCVAPVPPTRRSSINSDSVVPKSRNSSIDLNASSVKRPVLPQGSSCASSLTMASSTTSESQPSSNGKTAMLNNNSNSSGHLNRRSGSTYDTQWPEHCAPLQQEQHRHQHPSSTCSWTGSHPPVSVTTQAQINSQRGPPSTIVQEPTMNRTQPPGNPMSYETANLMSELSSQLQQLATRSVNDPVPDPPPEFSSNRSDEDFELPPPPPPSMFQTNTVGSENVLMTPTPPDALMSALKQSVGDRAARMAASQSAATNPQ